MDKPGLWAKFVVIIGPIGAAVLPIGALGSRFGLWGFELGLQLIFGGVLLAAIALVLGIAVFVFALKRQQPANKMPAAVGALAGAAVLAWTGVQFMAALSTSAPSPIHNVSTDRDDPPTFDKVAALRGAGANALDYDAEDAQTQAQAYPALIGVRSADGVEASFEMAVAVARELGWEIVNEDREQGIVEATDTTFWFGFKDDVVIRIRADGTGSKVDMRSVSRVGRSDLGTNARRIADFLERFQVGR